MTEIIELKTERLRLRQWKQEDFPAFAMLNADPEVMRYYPDTLNEEESNDMAQRFESLLAYRGWGFWVVEKLDDKKFMGFVGLHEPTYDLPVTPCVEIGWRLARKYWGYGYATEAAKASLMVAFENLDLPEVYSFTSVLNKKSQAVMERLEMVNMKQNFEHPMIPGNSPLREHVLYRIDKKS
ncbi:MAG: GNAT family N-acetyltransferase [Gammaproteobacteria bacterium]